MSWTGSSDVIFYCGNYVDIARRPFYESEKVQARAPNDNNSDALPLYVE